MKNKKGNELSKEFWYIFIAICVFLIIFVAVGFGIFSNKKDEVIEKNENGGNITLNYTNNITGLSIKDVSPITDTIGMKKSEDGDYFDFSINVDLDNATSIEYEISAIKDEKNSTISDDDIRIYLEREESGTYTKVFGPDKFSPLKKDSSIGSQTGSMILASVIKKKSTVDNYRLRMWLSDKSLIATGNYSVEIVVNGKAK